MRLFAWTQTFKSIVKHYQAVCCDRDILNRACFWHPRGTATERQTEEDPELFVHARLLKPRHDAMLTSVLT